MKEVLSLRDFSVTYKNKNKSVYAVKNINLDVYEGDSLGIVGESGSGKSTLANAVLKLLPEKSSEITGTAIFIGKQLNSLSKKEMQDVRWKELAVVFQKAMSSLSPVHKIGMQIEDIYKVHCPNASKTEIIQRADELFKLVNLSNRVYKLYPHQLSGGMLQRVNIAISLMHKPNLLILDEATTALDVVTQGQILKEIVSMEEKLNMTRIMITHDMSVVASSCNKIAVMYAGEMMEVGYVKDVLQEPKHPYTKGLLGSFPSLKGERKQINAISGSLPDLSLLYDSCIFAPRCEKAMDICFKKKPKDTNLGEAHNVACFLYGGDEDEQ